MEHDTSNHDDRMPEISGAVSQTAQPLLLCETQSAYLDEPNGPNQAARAKHGCSGGDRAL
jgi:hypothetical protein